MKARQKLTVRQTKQITEAVAREYQYQYEKASRISAYRMMLIVLYNLRFVFKFKKRLHDFFNAICENNADVDKWKKSDVMASVMVKRLEESGCDFNGAFDELIAYEEEEYKKTQNEEVEKRCAGK